MPKCPSCSGTFPGGKFCPKDGTALLPDERGVADQDELVGQVVADRFRIVSLLGSGGMGTVYEAEHTFIKKKVALKLLRPSITSNPEAVARFQREALAASTIGHKNIVGIDDFGRLVDGQVYLTMEFLDGEPLNEVLDRGQVSLERVLDVAIQVCQGLAVAHAEGIVHRDMKPENIFLVDDGDTAKILDFGIAKVTRGGDDNTNLTKTGAVFGTPNYMAPEQALGEKVDHRADIYAMGVILYEMLTGSVPFTSESFLAVLTQHVTATPTPPSERCSRQIPLELEQLVLRAMAKKPGQRFQHISEMMEILEALRHEASAEDRVQSAGAAGATRIPATMPPDNDGGAEEVLSVKQTATAGELVPEVPAPRRMGLILGIAGLVLLMLAGGAVAMFHLQKSAPQTPLAGAQPGVPGEPYPDQKREPGEPKQEPEEPKPEPRKQPPTEPRTVEVIIDSRPSRAVIRDEKKKQLGMTPNVISVERDKKRVVYLHRRGYHRKPVELFGDKTKKIIVELDPLPPTHRPPRKSAKKPAKSIKTTPKRKPAPKPRRVSDHDHDSDRQRGNDRSSHEDEPLTPEGY